MATHKHTYTTEEKFGTPAKASTRVTRLTDGKCAGVCCKVPQQGRVWSIYSSNLKCAILQRQCLLVGVCYKATLPQDVLLTVIAVISAVLTCAACLDKQR